MADATFQSTPDGAQEDSLVEALVSKPLPMRPGLPLVEDWDCLRVRFYCLSPSVGTQGSTEDSARHFSSPFSPSSLSSTGH